jgi:hypothetical protein
MDNFNTGLNESPPATRSALGEIWSQLKAGAFVDAPRMVGKAMQYVSSPGNGIYESGKNLVEDTQAIESLPEMQASDTTGRPVVNALSRGARMIPQSIAPALATGAVLSGAGVPAAVATIVGATIPAIPAGLAQAQETYEKGLLKHGITPEQAEGMPDDPRVQEVKNAARMTGGIEWGGETAGGALAGRFVGVGGKAAGALASKILNRGEQTAAQTILKSFTRPQAAARYGLDLAGTTAGETLTEMGQGAGEAAIERHYGYDTTNPWDAAKDAIAPTLGMSALLAPFGIPAHLAHSGKMNQLVTALQDPATPHEARAQAAEIVFDELNKVSPDAAHNFALHSFDALHDEEHTGSAPYGLALDDSVIGPHTPRAMQTEEADPGNSVTTGTLPQPVPTGVLSRAVAKLTPPAVVLPESSMGLGYGATDGLKESAPVIQTAQPAIMANVHDEHLVNTPAVQPLHEVIRATSPVAIPSSALHDDLKMFVDMGQEMTAASGKQQQIWTATDNESNARMEAVMNEHILPAAEQGLIPKDNHGGYVIATDHGQLRIYPPTNQQQHYEIGYDTLSAGQTAPTNTPALNKFQQTVHDNLLRKQQAGETLTEHQGRVLEKLQAKIANPFNAPVVTTFTRKAIEDAFPRQTVSDDGAGFTVALKNGAMIRVAHTGEIHFDTGAAETAYSRQLSATEKPVASFQRLDHAAIISLTEQGTGEINHETFHAAMALALNSNQRDIILKRFGSEESAAAEYQRLKDSGAFGNNRGHLFLNMIYRFFSKIRSLFDRTHGIFRDVATGKIWEQSGNTVEAAPVMYSMKELGAKLVTVKGHISRYSDKSTFIKADVKPAMKAAGDGLAASWDGLKAAVNPMARSSEAEEAGRILIEGMGKQEHNKEQFIKRLNKAVGESTQQTTRTARLLDLMQSSTTLADKIFNRMSEAVRLAFMQNMDTGQQQATPELQRIADTIKAMFTEKVEQVQAMGTGALEQARDNYFPHIWVRSEDAAREIKSRLSKRQLEGPKTFTKARVFDDIMTGIDAGFTLVSTNPIDLVFLKMAEMDKYINTHVTLQAMEESGLVQLISAGEQLPDGYGDISGRYGIVTKKGFIDPDTGMEGERKSYRYIAREDVAQVFNNYLSQNLYNNKYLGKPFTGYMAAANTLNQFQLGLFSAFHAGFTSIESVISHVALGIKALSRGDYKEAVKYLKQAPAAAYLNPKLGDKVIKAWMGDPAAAQEMPHIIEWLEMAGARRILESRFRTNQTQKMLQAWQEGNPAGSLLRGIPALVEQSARPIMEWLVPRQKFGVFAELANDWATRNPNATHEETRKAMQQMWNRVDSRLGQVVYDRLFVHNVAKNLTQAIIRAPGWTGGTILEVGGGIMDLGTYARHLIAGKKPEMTDRTAYTLAMLTTTAVANAILTSLFTGEPPKDWKDLVAFRTGGKDERGNPERFMLPTYMKDVWAYSQAPGTTLMHKSHPLLSLIGDTIRNKDYFGTEIRHQGDNPIMQLAQLGGFTAKAFVPFWMKGVAKELERGGSLLSMAAPLIGVMPAPSDMNSTEAERLASELVRARMPATAKTHEQFERNQLISHLTSLVRRNASEGAQEVRQVLSERKITPLQAQHIMVNARLSPIVAVFKRLSYDEAVKVFEVANEKEKRQLRVILAAKRARHIG